jgi:hypothetical protein
LDALQSAFHEFALETRDPAAAQAVVVANRRKCNLLGLDQARCLDLTVIEPAQHATRYEKVKRVIEELCQLPPPSPLTEDESVG